MAHWEWRCSKWKLECINIEMRIFFLQCSDNKTFTILEEYVMIRQLLKWLNGRDSSLHFKYLMIFGKPNSYFHQRFILQVRFSAVKAQPNNYVRSHESACHGHLLCMFGKINGTCVEIETSF